MTWTRFGQIALLCAGLGFVVQNSACVYRDLTFLHSARLAQERRAAQPAPKPAPPQEAQP